jgi:hypothetical protein
MLRLKLTEEPTKVAEKQDDQKTGKPDSVGSEAELIGRIIQSEQKLSEYFTTIITKSVTEQIERRNMARLRMFGIISVIVVSLMIPAITLWVRATITNQTEVTVQDQFSAAIEQLEVRFGDETKRLEQDFESFLSRERIYLTFANYALYLADRSHVPEWELKNVLEVLEQIAPEPDLTGRPDFPFLLDLVVRTAIKHGYADTLDILEDRMQDVLASSPRTMPRLARHYGESIVGDRFISANRLEKVVKKFRRYLDLSISAPDYSRLLSLQLLVENKLDDELARNRAKAIQLYVLDLTPVQKAAFIEETVRYSNPDYRDVPATARNKRIANTAGTMVVDEAQFYADIIKGNGVLAALHQLASYEANLENTGIATALTAFRRVVLSGTSSGEDPKLLKSARQLVRGEFNLWLRNPLIIESLRSQNRTTGGYTEQQIKVLESIWQDEFNSDQYDLIAELLDRPVSRYLKRVKLSALGAYHEIHLMDGVGLLAGASDVNEDYWQGDEAKWQKTYQGERGALHIGNLKFDSSALAWEIQISLPVVDPETQELLGAITIGLDPSALVETSL